MLTAIKTYTGGYAPGVDAGAGLSAVTLSDKLTLATRLGHLGSLPRFEAPVTYILPLEV